MGEMLGNLRVGVEAVHHIEELCVLGRLHREIRGAAAAEDHHVQPVRPLESLIHMADLGRLGENLHIRGIPPCEHCL